jgi:hypothetical protein
VATFQRITDIENMAPSWDVSKDGITVREWGEINTADMVDAAEASGLPELGDPYDAVKYPDVTLRKIRIKPDVGGQRLGTGAFPNAANPGWSLVELEWSDEAPDGGGQITKAGQKFSTIVFSRGQQTVYYGIDTTLTGGNTTINVASATPLQLAPPINDGDGIGIAVGKLEVIVTRGYAKGSEPNYASFSALLDKLNLNPMTLPAIFKSTQTWSAARGELRYVGPEVDPQGKLVVVRHRFEFARDHLVRFQTRKADGSLSRRYAARVDDYADLSGLV